MAVGQERVVVIPGPEQVGVQDVIGERPEHRAVPAISPPVAEARIGMRETAAPIVMPVVAETCMGEAILGEVAASQMGGAHRGGPTGYISCRECTSCIAKCARSAPCEMMGAKPVTCKAAPADMEAAASDTESPTTRMQTPEMRATEVHASQAHAAQMHATEAHTAQVNATQPAKAH